MTVLVNTATGTVRRSVHTRDSIPVCHMGGVGRTISGTSRLTATKSVIFVSPTDTDFSVCTGFRIQNGRFGRLMGTLS